MTISAGTSTPVSSVRWGSITIACAPPDSARFVFRRMASDSTQDVPGDAQLGHAFPEPPSELAACRRSGVSRCARSIRESQFQEFIAKNGHPAARGAFVLTMNTEIYLGRGVVLSGGTLAVSARPIPGAASRFELVRRCLVVDWDVLHDERNWEEVNHIEPPWFTNASGDFLLLDREAYQELRGFNEVYRNAKIHMDGNFCVKAHASGMSLVNIGNSVFHVGRGTLHAQRDAYRDRPADAPWGDIRWNSTVLYENGPEWGLGDAPERIPMSALRTWILTGGLAVRRCSAAGCFSRCANCSSTRRRSVLSCAARCPRSRGVRALPNANAPRHS